MLKEEKKKNSKLCRNIYKKIKNNSKLGRNTNQPVDKTTLRLLRWHQKTKGIAI